MLGFNIVGTSLNQLFLIPEWKTIFRGEISNSKAGWFAQIEFLIARWFSGQGWLSTLIYNFTYEYDRGVFSALFFSLNYFYIFLVSMYLMNLDRIYLKNQIDGDYSFEESHYRPLTEQFGLTADVNQRNEIYLKFASVG